MNFTILMTLIGGFTFLFLILSLMANRSAYRENDPYACPTCHTFHRRHERYIVLFNDPDSHAYDHWKLREY